MQLDGTVGFLLLATGSVLGFLLALGLAVWLYELHVQKHGRPGGTSMGDALGNLIDVFDPGAARAARDLKDQRNVGPVAPTPDPDPDDGLQIELGPGGIPKSVRIRRER